MSQLLNSLGAIALLAVAGYLARRRGLFSEEGTRVLSKFIYCFGLPSLFFINTARLEWTVHDLWIVAGSVTPILLVFLVLFLLHAVGPMDRVHFTAASLAVVFGSNAFFGLAFFQALYGTDALRDPILAATLLGILGVMGTVWLLEYGTGSGHLGRALTGVIRSPILLGVVAGAVFNAMAWEPEVIFKPLGMLGGSAPALAIFALGMFIEDHVSIDHLREAIGYTALRCLSLPLVGFALILGGHAQFGEASEFLFLQTGVPSAISVAIFAQRYDFKTGVMTGMVVLTSLVSFPLLAALYALSKAMAL